MFLIISIADLGQFSTSQLCLRYHGCNDSFREISIRKKSWCDECPSVQKQSYPLTDGNHDHVESPNGWIGSRMCTFFINNP
ncbi:hypothetical protein ACHAXM_008686 [Skeletonema potamos]